VVNTHSFYTLEGDFDQHGYIGSREQPREGLFIIERTNFILI